MSSPESPPHGLIGREEKEYRSQPPDARRVTIENADHFFTLTAQDEFDRAVEVFWWENEAK
jgi:pimeloyl-ACP methyl ester carboxylesterase